MKLLCILFLLLSTTIFCEQYIQDDLVVGVNRFKGKKVYITAENGSAIIEIKGKSYYSDEIKEKEVEHISLSGSLVKYGNKKSDRIYLYKGTPETIIKISRDGKKFSRYRGDFEFIPYKGNVLPINSVQSEDYIYSVVPSEIGNYFPEEAIKAQALAARSYLYFGLKSSKYGNFDLFDNVNSQMYLGMDRENDRVRGYIDKTRGEVILYKEKPINALYYSTSGGITANSEDVWTGMKVPYLRSVNDRGNEKRSPRLNWEIRISKSDVSRRFGFKVSSLKIVEVKNKRVNKIKVSGSKIKIITGDKFRSIIGYAKIYSTQFRVKSSGNYFILTGHGSGHGVGMSQYGAYGLASKGKNYKDILNHYYHNVDIKKYNHHK